MWKKLIRVVATAMFIVAMLTLSGCSNNTVENQPETTQQTETISEIDSFAMSVDMVKTHYDINEMYKGQVIEAANQALIMEGFLDEMPHLYSDAEYKNRITEIYNVVKNMDINKEGLLKEEGSEKYFYDLNHIVERMYNKFQ